VNRTDRLHALSEELRRAGWLEVSTRTIKRDVAALQQAGLPVWSQAGPGGGYVLDEAATLPPVNLTPAQAVAVAVALAAQTDAPYAIDGRTAIEKILDVLDPAARERAEQLAGRVWVRTSPAERTAALAAVEEGLAQRRVLVLNYQDRLGRPSHRRVEPHLLARTNDQ